MESTAEQLKAEGVATVTIDLSQMGSQLDAETWYLGLLTTIEDSLELETDVIEWWEKHKHLGMTQRFTVFLSQVLLSAIQAQIVVFIDEIDTTLSLDFTDDFFVAIRYLYNVRADIPELKRLSFVLIGVATPDDLIADPQRTPFNIGQRVDLTDFTFEEAQPLTKGLDLSPEKAEKVLRWVMKWTSGHPYLTQRLCLVISDIDEGDLSEENVNRVVASTFLDETSELDNNLQFVRDMLTKRAPDPTAVLTTYREIRMGRRPVLDEEQSLVKSYLKLSGVVRRENDVLIVRNPIYEEVFDRKWVMEHWPGHWLKRIASTVVDCAKNLRHQGSH
jgi:hypothetical protein